MNTISNNFLNEVDCSFKKIYTDDSAIIALLIPLFLLLVLRMVTL